MYVLYGKRGPAAQIEYCYSEVVHIEDRIGIAQKYLTKEYLLTLGYELLGEIKDVSELPSFLKAWKSKEISSEITTPLKQIQPEKDGGTDTPKAELPNPDPMSERLPNAEAGQEQSWWK